MKLTFFSCYNNILKLIPITGIFTALAACQTFRALTAVLRHYSGSDSVLIKISISFNIINNNEQLVPIKMPPSIPFSSLDSECHTVEGSTIQPFLSRKQSKSNAEWAHSISPAIFVKPGQFLGSSLWMPNSKRTRYPGRFHRRLWAGAGASRESGQSGRVRLHWQWREQRTYKS